MSGRIQKENGKRTIQIFQRMLSLMIFKSTTYGFIGMMVLLAVYFSVVSLISGWPFALNQFSRFWYFVVSLAVGFGIQIGLYTYLKNAIHQNGSSDVLIVSGTTSTAAMLSCCAHYLVNILPVIGITGIISFVSQYQIELFGIGIISNLLGVAYLINKLIKFKSVQLKYE